MKQLATSALAAAAVAAWLGFAAVDAAPQSWTGYVSDSQCGGDHGGEVDPKECTLKCVAAGDKFVLMVDDGTTMVPIANQDFAGLRDHAGEQVTVTGELKDGAIVVRAIGKPTS